MSFIEPEGDSNPSDVTFSPVAFADATATFVLFGATSSLLGPLLVSLARRYDLSLPTAGTVVSVFFVGAFLGVPLGYVGVRRLRGNTVLAMMMALTVLGALIAWTSDLWRTFVFGVFVIGLAFGAVDFALNTLLVRTEVRGRGHRLSLANAGYGVGAVVGPLLIIAIHPSNFPVLFAAIAVTSVALAFFFGGIHAPPLHAVHQRRSLFIKGRRRSILWTFVLAYVLYVCTETSASGWMAPQLLRGGYSQSLASGVTAGFWGALALGRMIAGPLAKRWSEPVLVLGGLAVAVVLSVTAILNGVAPYSYALLGLIIASVYPMGLIWYTTLCPGDSDGLATLILCMMLGGVAGPATESLMVSISGIHAVPVVIAVFALCDLAVFASVLRFEPSGQVL